MERNFNNEEFERSLKEHADQYRMYPSEKVWKGIFSALHARRRWFGLGAILLLLSGSFVTLIMVNSPTGNRQDANVKPVTNPPLKNTEPNIEKIPSIGTPSLIAERDHQSLQQQKLLSFEVNNVVPENRMRETILISPILFNNDVAALTNQLFIAQSTDVVTDQDFYSKGMSGIFSRTVPQEKNLFAQVDIFPWTIESVLNSFHKVRNKNKIGLQLYFTPTISYRKLSENKSFLRSATPNIPYSYAALYDINNAVTHKPDIGLELGFAARYPVSNGLKIKAGLQFNVNRYEIKAFNYPVEVATIALNSGGARRDSFNMLSSYRNFSGTNANWLQNFYFQISTPIGLELKLTGDDKIQFGLATTIQPTYILGDRAYLISTDYKNYAEVPWLIRRWNVNTNLETFVAYSTGKLKWQVGPQVRYQLLSSFIKKYPVKENLFDFGLKVGISLNNQ
jgi:hypothetical protein